MPTVNGVGSGLDIESLIKASLIYRQTAVKRLQAKQAMVSAQQGAVLGLRSRVSAFQSAAEGIKDLTSGLMIAYNDGEGLLLNADSTSTPGSHDVVVHSMAQAHRLAAAGVADRNSTAIAGSSGNFKLRVGDGETVSVAVDALTTLEDLVERINAAENNTSVRASIVNDGSKATSYRMVLTSSQTGADNIINITENDTTLNFATNSYEQPFAYTGNSTSYTGTASSAGTFTGTKSEAYLIEIVDAGAAGVATYKVSLDGGVTWDDDNGRGYQTSITPAQLGGSDSHKGLTLGFSDSGDLTSGDRFELDAFNPDIKEARDAFVEVDGVAVRAASNSISGALQGVTFDLKKADATETQKVTIKRTTAGISSKLGAFVGAYNDLIGGIRSQQQYDSEKEQAGSLLGDQVANRIVYDISSAVSRNVEGVTGSFSNLAEIGVTVSATGQLSLDSAKLTDALEADAASVLEVLEGATTPSTSELVAVSVPSTAPADNYSVKVTQAPAVASALGTAAMTSALSADEILNFTYSSDANQTSPTSKVFQVSLASGSSLAEIIAMLNDEFKAQGTDLVASDESGVLSIQTAEYGADMKLTVFSDRAEGVGTTQIGTTVITGQGVDIEGSVGTFAATGMGALLKVEFGALDGMQVKYTGNSTGVVGSLAIVQGAASNFASIAGSLMDDENGAIAARDKALQNQIEAIQRRIDERNRMLKLTEARVRKKYVALDSSLGKLKSQGDAMMSQLQAMMSQSRSE